MLRWSALECWWCWCKRIVTIHYRAIWCDVEECALSTKLASAFHKVLTWRRSHRGFRVVREGAGSACLALSLEEELAWHVLGICSISQPLNPLHPGRVCSLLFFGGLLGIPVGAKPPISPAGPPKGLCDPVTGIGTAPLRSICILAPFGVLDTESMECLC